MKFISYLTEKIKKASKNESSCLWSHTTITTTELFYFNKGIESLNLDNYVRGRGEKKNFEVDGYKFEFGISMFELKGYTKIETPEGIVFEVSDVKYKNQRNVDVRFYVGQ